MTTTFDEIRQKNPLHEVVQRYTKLKGSATHGWKGKCPIHRERKGEALTVFVADDGTERWKCHGKCGSGGDVVDFLVAMGEGSDEDVRRRLTGGASAPSLTGRPARRAGPQPPQVKPAAPSLTIVPFLEPPRAGASVKAYNPKREKATGCRPLGWFEYFTTDGELIGIVVRELIDGEKVFRTLQQTVEHGLTWVNFAKPSPLYGLDRLRPDTKQVVLVEGEGKADELQAVVPAGVAVLGLYQGAASAHLADYAPLVATKLPTILWPDHDRAGRRAMAQAARRLRETNALCVIAPEPDRPEGWDAADLVRELGAWPAVKEWMRARKQSLPKGWCDEHDPPRDAAPEPIRLDDRRPAQPKPQLVQTQQPDPEPVTMSVIEREWKPLKARPTTADCTSRIVGKDVADGKGGTRKQAAPENPYNWRVWLHYHPSLWDVFAVNAHDDAVWMHGRPPWSRDPDWRPQPFDADALQQLVVYLSGLGLKVKPAPLGDLVQMHARHTRTFNALTQYLDRVAAEWDGVERLAEWAQTYLGAPPIAITRHMARRWMIGAVARAYRPGCKMDNVLLLEGPQGAGKSEVFKVLARAAGSSSYYEENIEHLDPQKVYSLMRGVWIAEIAEMSAYSKRDAAEWKKFVTRQDDNHRRLFTDQKMLAPRRFALAATINPDGDGYLNDPTGARRIWPILVGTIDIESLTRDIDQLWGEAAYAFKAGEPWYLTREEEAEARIEQAERSIEDPLLAQIAGLLQTKHQLGDYDNEVVPWRLMDALGVPSERRDNKLSRRLTAIMGQLGFEKQMLRRDGAQSRVYVKRGAKP